MSTLHHTENGYLIANAVAFDVSDITASNAKIICSPTLGERVRYAQDLPVHYIDFPGEYEINDYLVQCWVSDEKLSYQIKMPNQQSFGIASNEWAFDVATFDTATTLYCATQSVADEAVKQEITAECVLISAESKPEGE